MKKFLILLLYISSTRAGIILKKDQTHLSFDANLSEIVKPRDIQRLKSGLLNRLLIKYQLEDRKNNVVIENAAIKLFQYDLWNDSFIQKTIHINENKRVEIPAKGQKELDLFANLSNISITSSEILQKGIEYRLKAIVKVNPITQEQMDVAQRQISKMNFSDNTKIDINSNSKSQDERKTTTSLPFFTKLAGQVVSNSDQEIVIYSDWIQL